MASQAQRQRCDCQELSYSSSNHMGFVEIAVERISASRTCSKALTGCFVQIKVGSSRGRSCGYDLVKLKVESIPRATEEIFRQPPATRSEIQS